MAGARTHRLVDFDSQGHERTWQYEYRRRSDGGLRLEATKVQRGAARKASPMGDGHLEGEVNAADERAEIVAHGRGAWDFDPRRGGLKSMVFKEGVRVGSPRHGASGRRGGSFLQEEDMGRELHKSWKQTLHGMDSGNTSGNGSSPGMLSELEVDVDLDIEVHQDASQPLVPSKVLSHTALLQRLGARQRVVLSYPTRSTARSSSTGPGRARHSASRPSGRFRVPRQAYAAVLDAGGDDSKKLAGELRRLASEDIGGPEALVDLLREASGAGAAQEGGGAPRRLALLKALSVPHGQRDAHGQEQALAQIVGSATASRQERYAALESLLSLRSPGRATQAALEGFAFAEAGGGLHQSAVDDRLRNRAVLGLGAVAPRSPEVFASSVERLVLAGEGLLPRPSRAGRRAAAAAPAEALVLAALENAYPAWGRAARSAGREEPPRRAHGRAVAFVRRALALRAPRAAQARPAGALARLARKMGVLAPQPKQSMAQRHVVSRQLQGKNTSNSSQCVNFEHRYGSALANFTIGDSAFLADFNGDFKTFAVLSDAGDLSAGARLHTPMSVDIWDGAFQADVMDLDVQAYFHSVTLRDDGAAECGGLRDASADVEGGCADVEAILRERSSCVELGGDLQLMGENVWSSSTKKDLGDFSVASALGGVLDGAERAIEGGTDAPSGDGRWERVLEGEEVAVSIWIVSITLRFSAGAALDVSGASTAVSAAIDPNSSALSLDSVVSWRPSAEAYGTVGVGLQAVGFKVSVDGKIFFLAGGLPAEAKVLSSGGDVQDVQASFGLTGHMNNLRGAIILTVDFLWWEVYRAALFEWDGPLAMDWTLWPTPSSTHLGDIS